MKIPQYAIAVSLIVVSGALGYMAVQRDPPIQVVKQSLLDVSVRPGENLERRVTLIQQKRCEIHSTRYIVDADSVRHELEPINYQFGIGTLRKEQELVLRIPIPDDIALGPARFEMTTRYRCNLLHSVWPIYRLNTLFFEVVP